MVATHASGGHMVAAGNTPGQEPAEGMSFSDIWHILEGIPDPEIPAISLVDLGAIRAVTQAGDTLEITVTPTYSGCPATAVINMDIENALHDAGIANVAIKRQLSPPWTTDWLSAKGRTALEKYGIAPPNAAGPNRCPRCQSTDLTRISQFGSTPCKAQWRCDTCLEPFDYFKCI